MSTDLTRPRRPTAAQWAVFGLSVGLAVVVSFAYRFALSLSAFWLTDVRGVAVLSVVLGWVYFNRHERRMAEIV